MCEFLPPLLPQLPALPSDPQYLQVQGGPSKNETRSKEVGGRNATIYQLQSVSNKLLPSNQAA